MGKLPAGSRRLGLLPAGPQAPRCQRGAREGCALRGRSGTCWGPPIPPPPVDVWGGVGLEGWGPAQAAHRVLVVVVVAAAPRRSRRGFRVPGLDRCQEAWGFGVTPARGWAFARAPLVLVKQTGGERGRGRDRPG